MHEYSSTLFHTIQVKLLANIQYHFNQFDFGSFAARQQMIIAPPTQNQQMGQATATIKTEGGYQTVPVILQHGNNQMGNIQIQKQMGGMGQQIIQPVVSEIGIQFG